VTLLLNLSDGKCFCHTHTSSLSHGKISRFFHTSLWIRYAHPSHQYALIQRPFSQAMTKHP
jgi:hypothetical protein